MLHRLSTPGSARSVWSQVSCGAAFVRLRSSAAWRSRQSMPDRPRRSRSAAFPFGVSRTARPEPIRATQPLPRNVSCSFAPANPAMCWRRSVQSRHPRARGPFAGPQFRWAQPECVGQPGQAGRGEGEAAGLVQQPRLGHRVGHRDAEPSGEVVVAGTACVAGPLSRSPPATRAPRPGEARSGPTDPQEGARPKGRRAVRTGDDPGAVRRAGRRR